MVKVAIIGTGGTIGPPIIESLKSNPKVESPIKAVTTKDKQSDEFVTYLKYCLDDINLMEQLKGIDVLISLPIVNPKISADLKKILAQVKPKIYIPGEFGSDNDTIPEHLMHPFFKAKVDHLDQIGDLNVKVVNIITGFFKIPPIYLCNFVGHVGIDVDNKTVTYYGSPQTPLSYIKQNDLANVTSAIVTTDADKLKSKYVVKSHVLSLQEFVKKYEQEKGIELTPIYKTKQDAVEEIESIFKDRVPGQSDFPRFLNLYLGMGKGVVFDKFDNEEINPGESLWKWEDSY